MGLIMLLGTVLLLIDNIERSFNAIWQVKKPRGLFRQITDYSSLILLLPVLLVISSGLSIFMSTYVKELQNFMVLAPVLKFFVRLIPYALIWGMFIGLYIFMPNTKVHFRHALISGILQCALFPRTALLGASGIVFMLIMLASLSGFSGGIPVTMLLVAALYFGQQVYDIIFVHDNVANFMHIVGGLCGTAFGYYSALHSRRRPAKAVKFSSTNSRRKR